MKKEATKLIRGVQLKEYYFFSFLHWVFKSSNNETNLTHLSVWYAQWHK